MSEMSLVDYDKSILYDSDNLKVKHVNGFIYVNDLKIPTSHLVNKHETYGDESNLVILLNDNHILCMKNLQIIETVGKIATPIFVFEDKIIIAVKFHNSYSVCVYNFSGQRLSQTCTFPDKSFEFVCTNNRIFVSHSESTLNGFDFDCNNTSKRFETEYIKQGMVTKNNTLIYATNGQIKLFNETLENISLIEWNISGLCGIHKDLLYFSSDNSIVCYDLFSKNVKYEIKGTNPVQKVFFHKNYGLFLVDSNLGVFDTSLGKMLFYTKIPGAKTISVINGPVVKTHSGVYKKLNIIN